jgi:acetyl esterase/lipase
MNRSWNLAVFATLFLALVFYAAYPQSLSDADITLYEDIVFAAPDGHELKLDIAVPKYLTGPAPAIVDIQGGAWRVINKSPKDALFYAKYGFVGVSITHRTSDIAIFPAAIHDCKTAIRWLRAHAKKYSINPNKIGVSGYSSGGHLAALLGTSAGDHFLEGDGGYEEYSSAVQAVVDHFGPTDFLRMNETDLPDRMDHFAAESPESLFLGGPVGEKAELARLANPINYIDPSDPPTLIGHGEMDGMVVIGQSELLYEALKKAGVPSEFIRMKNADHMYRPYRWDAEVSPSVTEMDQRTVDWFERWLGKPPLDTAAIARKPPEAARSARKPIRLGYRLTLELPGKTAESYCHGRFQIRGEGRVLAEGELRMDNLSTEEGRFFQQDCIIEDADLIGKEILWNFRGEIFDSILAEKSEIMYMQGETYDPAIKAVGFVIQIKDGNSVDIKKKIYR